MVLTIVISSQQELKDMQFAEHKRLMEILDEEREKILIEKAKLETMERLKTPTNTSTKRQSELDAAIKIAQVLTLFLLVQLQILTQNSQLFCSNFTFHLIYFKKDAAKSADIERENFIEQQRKHELKKRELMEKESMLQAQQSELELRISQAKDQKVNFSI